MTTTKRVVVVFERLEAGGVQAAANFEIGTPSSAFNGQSDTMVGTALPDFMSETTAGATLNAVGLTRVVDKLSAGANPGRKLETTRVKPPPHSSPFDSQSFP